MPWVTVSHGVPVHRPAYDSYGSKLYCKRGTKEAHVSGFFAAIFYSIVKRIATKVVTCQPNMYIGRTAGKVRRSMSYVLKSELYAANHFNTVQT